MGLGRLDRTTRIVRSSFPWGRRSLIVWILDRRRRTRWSRTGRSRALQGWGGYLRPLRGSLRPLGRSGNRTRLWGSWTCGSRTLGGNRSSRFLIGWSGPDTDTAHALPTKGDAHVAEQHDLLSVPLIRFRDTTEDVGDRVGVDRLKNHALGVRLHEMENKPIFGLVIGADVCALFDIVDCENEALAAIFLGEKAR